MNPHSIKARSTIAAAGLLLLALVVGGVGLDLAIRYRVQSEVFFSAEQVAARWSAAARNGAVPRPIPTTSDITLVQFVNARGEVVDSSMQAAGMRPLSTLRPPADDRLQKRTECSAQGRCIMLMANRVTPAPDSPVVYAGTAQPSLLATHNLEYAIAAGGVLILVAVASMTWWAMGRTLRSVERERQFASTTSHELRTPIAGLRAHLEEALLYPDDVDPRDTIQGALRATGRLEAIVDDLLLLTRLHGAAAAEPELIELGTLVTEEVSALAPTMPVCVLADGDVRVCGSRIRLARVIGNLLSNAQRHAVSAVTVTVDSVGDQAVVAITDDGAGVPPADRERVFELFVRLDEGRRLDSGGSGLGLAISRDIARAHNGTLQIEDSPVGARFVLTLPLAGTAGASADPAAEPGQTAAKPRRNTWFERPPSTGTRP
ncbi:sensor histidine kinase [Microbispora hainanensis]|uniref:histidine kinase n=1 Tax=Microbispora hainanensis TaxID=568844 RepID=A0A544Z1J8_9ACTN|nr:HAMP domain-containing sensor histidine kinase [Microbispora hainanensis]TQS22927.1 HAMP domain-containing histidine kinase [Microbispora hainanensis]